MDQETWGKLSIGDDEAHGQWIPEGQRICSNYDWFSFAELLEYEAILYLSAPSFRGSFCLSQRVLDINILREKEEDLEHCTKKISRAE